MIEDRKLVFAMPCEFGDGCARVIWDPTAGPFHSWGSPDDCGMEKGDKLEIEVVAMTQAEIDALPEV